jgi:regulator of PEP synthase PpsR (kinase-PPPase family)
MSAKHQRKITATILSRSRDRVVGSRAANPQKLPIFLVSGGTGRTLDHVVHAAVAQFDHPHVDLVQKSQIRSCQAASLIVRHAANSHGVIVHTLVEPRIRAAVVREAEHLRVPVVDVLGPVLRLLEDQLQTAPRNQPGLSYELRKEQFDRGDSVDFTLAHDDGARLSTLANADVVIVGVSRVAKSVTCFYLAYRGIRAANVPIILNSNVPPELTNFDPKRVVCLTMNGERLRAIRSARLHAMGYGRVDDYIDRRKITQELQFAADLVRKFDWACIDVSYLSVEEVVTQILRLLEHNSPKSCSIKQGPRADRHLDH